MKVNIAITIAVLVLITVLTVAFLTFWEILTTVLDLAEKIAEN